VTEDDCDWVDDLGLTDEEILRRLVGLEGARVVVDPDCAALYARITEGHVARTREAAGRPDVMLDLDQDGRVLGLEVLGYDSTSVRPASPSLALPGREQSPSQPAGTGTGRTG
jgi:uncharacterized protein YuzE